MIAEKTYEKMFCLGQGDIQEQIVVWRLPYFTSKYDVS